MKVKCRTIRRAKVRDEEILILFRMIPTLVKLSTRILKREHAKLLKSLKH